MKPGTYNLDLYRGDSYGWQFQLWQDAAQTIPIDLAGAVAAAEIRDRTAGVVVVELACVITQPNTITMTMTPDLYVGAPAKKGVWDLQVTFPNGEVHTMLAGTVTITGDVTDSTPLARGLG